MLKKLKNTHLDKNTLKALFAWRGSYEDEDYKVIKAMHCLG